MRSARVRQVYAPTPRYMKGLIMCTNGSIAEFRGPGVHHRVDDSPDDIDMDMESRFRPSNNLGGRIILLGDGREIRADSGDTEMFDHDEDQDLDSQVSKQSSEGKSTGSNGEVDDATARSAREQTPAPTQANNVQESPSSDRTERSEAVDEKAASEKDNHAPAKASEASSVN
jgi:protein phosphatase PTC2/3